MDPTEEELIPPLPPIPENMGGRRQPPVTSDEYVTEAESQGVEVQKTVNTGLYDVDYDQLGNFIKGAEGFKEKAYRVETVRPDGTIDLGEPTIGYGSEFYEDDTRVQMDDTINRDAAETLWRHHIDKGVTELMKVPSFVKMNKNQKTGLISMAYNLGPYFMDHPDYPGLQGAIRGGDQEEIHKWMRKYILAGDPLVVSPGLVNRREDEIKLMKTPVE
tara:strand:+ start:115 stop:765 length:651 start_codon:yes stop_codon:yes gene_type:complete